MRPVLISCIKAKWLLAWFHTTHDILHNKLGIMCMLGGRTQDSHSLLELRTYILHYLLDQHTGLHGFGQVAQLSCISNTCPREPHTLHGSTTLE